MAAHDALADFDTHQGPRVSDSPEAGSAPVEATEETGGKDYTRPGLPGPVQAPCEIDTRNESKGFTGSAEEAPAARRAQRIPRLRPIAETTELLQQWVGRIESVSYEEGVFQATIYDLTDRAQPREIGDFFLSELAESDRSLVEPGAQFYWTIGYEVSEWGQVKRSSSIRLRRMPRWSTRDIVRARSEARQWMEQLGLDDSEN